MAFTGRGLAPPLFIAIPTGMNYRTERYPVVTLSLIGINTLIWLVTLICSLGTRGESDTWIYEHLWLIPAESHVWMYLTQMFVHAGFFHLFGNMIFLFLFGSCVEDMIGRLRFVIFYLVGGLVAELVYIAMSPAHFSSDIPMGGARPAPSAPAWAVYLPCCAPRRGHRVQVFSLAVLRLCPRAGEFEIPAWVAITLWFLKDLLFAVLGMFPSNRAGGGVAFGAHVGGLLGGVVLISIYKWMIRPREEPIVESGLILDPAVVFGRLHAPASGPSPSFNRPRQAKSRRFSCTTAPGPNRPLFTLSGRCRADAATR